ncbi:uncharacterized protein LOC113330482 [Papaver somniferum]|uniref:uncharacterized protein LOC113330482 n=1 Tax=Papaver somniferum TaxID=3469 RepID=UPI000E7060DB|nr:uncharacterized protein LOC113330482 [Papaver somniferum]
MNDRANDEKLCLKELPKSLTGTTYSWYDNLKEESVDSWKTLSTLFLGKFYSAERKITAIDLSMSRQRVGEDIGKYISRFRRLTLDCHEDINEEALVDICVRGMTPDFKGILINLKFQNFVELEEAADRIVNFIEDVPKESTWRTTIGAVLGTSYDEKSSARRENWNRPQGYGRNQGRGGIGRRDNKAPPPLPCSKDRIIKLLNQWVAEGEIKLPPTMVDINKMEKSSTNYRHYHRRMGHPTEECFAIRSIFERKRIAGELERTKKNDRA